MRQINVQKTSFYIFKLPNFGHKFLQKLASGFFFIFVCNLDSHIRKRGLGFDVNNNKVEYKTHLRIDTNKYARIQHTQHIRTHPNIDS